MDNVLQRAITNKPVTPRTGDTLAVPKLNFDLRGDLPALEGLVLLPSSTAYVKNLRTKSVKQLVRFQLNEKVAILKFEAEITCELPWSLKDLSRTSWSSINRF
jgi:hypothetical protein